MNAKRNTLRYDILDLAKFVCSWMVVVIHTTPLKAYSTIADVLTAQGVCRLAVPYFFATSAFLLFHNLGANQHENVSKLKRYSFRLIKLYFIWSFVYTVAYVFLHKNSIHWGAPFVISRIKLWLLEASHYHLWYLLATIYTVPLLYFLFRIKHGLFLRAIVPPLWTLRCLQYSYNWTGFFQPAFRWLQQNCDVATNVLFCAIPLMSVGILALRTYPSKSNHYWKKRMFLWFGIYLFELIIVYFTSPKKDHFEYLLSAPVLTYYLLCWLVTLDFSFNRNTISPYLRNGSIWIYCVHPLFILLWDHFIGGNGIRRFVIVAVCCALSASCYTSIKQKGVL